MIRTLRHWRWSIRTKILLVLSIVLITGVSLYLFLAARISVEDKMLLIYELNQSQVKNLGLQVEARLNRIVEKLDQIKPASTLSDPEIVAYGFMSLPEGPGGIETLQLVPEAKSFLEPYGWGVSELKKTINLDALDSEFSSSQEKIRIKQLTQRDGPPLFLVSEKISTHRYKIAFVKLTALASGFSSTGITTVYLSDSNGDPLVHSEGWKPQIELSSGQSEKDPLIESAQHSKLRSEVKRYEKELGSYFKVGIGNIVVVSRVPVAEAYAAARLLIQKSLIYALVVVTGAFLVALFFSHSLTAPIRQMVEATRKIAQGDFNSTVHTSSGDELALLASSFNSMTKNLKTSREQLIQSERLAAIGQVARGVGHEFGNVLQTIVGKADLALHQVKEASGDNSDDTQIASLKEKLEQILRAADRASLILRNLRSFSKTSGLRTQVQVNALIRETLSLVGHDLKRHSIQVSENFRYEGMIEAVGPELEQVFLNLTINAIHAMPKGGTLSFETSEDQEGVLISVKDTGTGIPTDVLPKVFETAFTTKGEKGSGLGLSVSKEIIEAHGGKIWVESQEGKGAYFFIRLPK